jgi:hypothetical protein
MRFGRLLRNVLIGTTMLWAVSAMAQQINFFPNFNSVAGLQFNGNAHQATWNSAKVLRLTDGYSGVGLFHPENSTAWFTVPQAVNAGFTTYFKFQIHTAAICCNPADGFAFVVQNASTSDTTYGANGLGGIHVRGGGAGGLGYAGIPNSFAVEFDTSQNLWDPSANHVAVQSCGIHTNGPVHSGSYTVGTHPNVTSCLVGSGINSNSPAVPHLGVTCGTSSCADGIVHEAVIEYDAPVTGTGNGTLAVWIDPAFIPGTHTPVSSAVKAINIPYNIDTTYNSQGISLGTGGLAYVGFTGSQTTMPEANDILAWEFTPHAAAQVTQTIPPGGTPAVYSFGGHDTIVNYFPGFVNNGCDGTTPSDPCLMTVVATPTSRNDFDNQRLKQQVPPIFAKEECVIYLGTGGKCIVYSITCQRTSAPNIDVQCPASLPNTCNAIGDPGCIIFSTSFFTADPITPTNADYLKADPIGTNNWISIFQSYNPSAFDGKTTGTGGTSSDFVATFNPNKP